MGFQDRFLDVGVRLHYRDYPSESSLTPVLCLHGLTRNSRDFHEAASWMQASRRVICPDQRGRGDSASDPEWKNYHPSTYVQDMFALLDQLEIDRCIVLGTSLGGLMAMLMAGQQPQRLAGVILNDVGPELNPEGIARVVAYVGQQPPVTSWEDAAEQCREAYGLSFPDWTRDDWLAHARRGYREDADGVRLDFDLNIGRALREVGGTLDDPWVLFEAVTMPCLLLRGSLSDILTRDLAGKMKQRMPSMLWQEIPNRGHAPMLDEPESREAIARFLDQIDA
ncbi:MAG: alpha/beta hydrolase [Xanthomonadales bacterium]|nr:alpha/beta hydrolase [Xanthomonadales bacterium]